MHPSAPLLLVGALIAAAIGFVSAPGVKLMDGTHAPPSVGARWERAFAFGGVTVVVLAILLGIWPG
jgi:hypothetical protein